MVKDVRRGTRSNDISVRVKLSLIYGHILVRAGALVRHRDTVPIRNGFREYECPDVDAGRRYLLSFRRITVSSIEVPSRSGHHTG